MTDLRKAAEMALEALESLDCGDTYKTHNAASALRQAIEQAEKQEPAAGKGKELSEQMKLCARNIAFAASGRVDMSLAAMQEMFALIDNACIGIDSPQPKREWVGLTEEEFDQTVPYCHNEFDLNDFKDFARAIEAKLKEKNRE